MAVVLRRPFIDVLDVSETPVTPTQDWGRCYFKNLSLAKERLEAHPVNTLSRFDVGCSSSLSTYWAWGPLPPPDTLYFVVEVGLLLGTVRPEAGLANPGTHPRASPTSRPGIVDLFHLCCLRVATGDAA